MSIYRESAYPYLTGVAASICNDEQVSSADIIEEMEEVRSRNPALRAERNAERFLLALFRIDLAIATALPTDYPYYEGKWASKQLKHIPSHNNMFVPRDFVAYANFVIGGAVYYIQSERAHQLSTSSIRAQVQAGVTHPVIPPFTPIFPGPGHDAAQLFELVRRGRHRDRQLRLHRVVEMAEKRIYELIRWRINHFEQIAANRARMSYLWAGANYVDDMDVDTICAHIRELYTIHDDRERRRNE